MIGCDCSVALCLFHWVVITDVAVSYWDIKNIIVNLYSAINTPLASVVNGSIVHTHLVKVVGKYAVYETLIC